ncbi:hypothetical protein BC830DRAFT_1088254 [Chytriomyces sp. MP71]|nr:hypothetical protein BC830DRAFT_1088254 [Chytriomyces sp. MP71]
MSHTSSHHPRPSHSHHTAIPRNDTTTTTTTTTNEDIASSITTILSTSVVMTAFPAPTQVTSPSTTFNAIPPAANTPISAASTSSAGETAAPSVAVAVSSPPVSQFPQSASASRLANVPSPSPGIAPNSGNGVPTGVPASTPPFTSINSTQLISVLVSVVAVVALLGSVAMYRRKLSVSQKHKKRNRVTAARSASAEYLADDESGPTESREKEDDTISLEVVQPHAAETPFWPFVDPRPSKGADEGVSDGTTVLASTETDAESGNAMPRKPSFELMQDSRAAAPDSPAFYGFGSHRLPVSNPLKQPHHAHGQVVIMAGLPDGLNLEEQAAVAYFTDAGSVSSMEPLEMSLPPRAAVGSIIKSAINPSVTFVSECPLPLERSGSVKGVVVWED